MEDDEISSLTYVQKEPDIEALRSAYDTTVRNLDPYFRLCRDSYDDRRNFWSGKSRDLRKHGSNAFPWEGASDTESHVINERITRLVALFVTALKRSNILASPVESGDAARAKVVSGFLKWMVSSGYIPRFYKEFELAANYLLERGILITYVGWHKEDRSFLQKLDLQEIKKRSPALAKLIDSGGSDEALVGLIRSSFDGVTNARAKKALKSLRKTGKAELPVIRRQIDAPLVKTLAPDGDFVFPSYVTDPQRAPFCFWKTYYTAQELENKVITEGWDKDFVDHMIENHRGVNISFVDSDQESGRRTSVTEETHTAEELIELIYCYQRLVDKLDGAEGIYCTVFHREFSGDKSSGIPGYAKFELLNGYEDYPVEVTRIAEDTKSLYDTMTVPSALRSVQYQVKVERDSRIDRNSITTVPPIMHPVGQAPTEWGPGRKVPYRRRGDIEFGPTPPYNTGSVEMEQTQQNQADRLVGLDEDSDISAVLKQFLVDKYLGHCAKVISMCYRAFQRFGPDHVFFRVVGAPGSQVAQKFEKGNPDENFDILINYDILDNDRETQEKKLQQLVSLIQIDKNGIIGVDDLVSVIANTIDPVLADSVLKPAQEAQEQIMKQVTDDLAKIYSGIEMPARPNGAQVALQLVQQYIQQPDIAQRLQADKAFAARIQKYVGQYQFSLQQAQNAEIGKIGTAPAQLGAARTQGIGIGV